MQLTLAVAALLPLASTLPLIPRQVSASSFYLVTTPSRTNSSDSSPLSPVSATSLFAPLHQPNLLLRLQRDGYNSLPSFTLADGRLRTQAADQFGKGSYEYATPAFIGGALQFVRNASGDARITLEEDEWVAVAGDIDHWGICPGPLGEKIIKYRPVEDVCAKTFLRAVAKPPY